MKDSSIMFILLSVHGSYIGVYIICPDNEDMYRLFLWNRLYYLHRLMTKGSVEDYNHMAVKQL